MIVKAWFRNYRYALFPGNKIHAAKWKLKKAGSDFIGQKNLWNKKASVPEKIISKTKAKNFRVTTLLAVNTTSLSYLCKTMCSNKLLNNGRIPVTPTMKKIASFSALLAEDSFWNCMLSHTNRPLSEIQVLQITLFCSLHFALCSFNKIALCFCKVNSYILIILIDIFYYIEK